MSKVVVTRVVLNSETFGGQVPPHKPKADHESELATLRARVEELERERDEAEAAKCRWFETHLAHRAACDALGKANAEMFKRAAEAERKGEQAEENAERCRQIAVAANPTSPACNHCWMRRGWRWSRLQVSAVSWTAKRKAQTTAISSI